MYMYVLSNIMLTYLEIIIILHVSNFVDGYLHNTMYMHKSCTHTTLVLCVCVCVCVCVCACGMVHVCVAEHWSSNPVVTGSNPV